MGFFHHPQERYSGLICPLMMRSISSTITTYSLRSGLGIISLAIISFSKTSARLLWIWNMNHHQIRLIHPFPKINFILQLSQWYLLVGAQLRYPIFDGFLLKSRRMFPKTDYQRGRRCQHVDVAAWLSNPAYSSCKDENKNLLNRGGSINRGSIYYSTCRQFVRESR